MRAYEGGLSAYLSLSLVPDAMHKMSEWSAQTISLIVRANAKYSGDKNYYIEGCEQEIF